MIGTLEADRLILAVNLDRTGEEKFQPTVPDVVLVQYEAFNPGRAREHEILPIVPLGTVYPGTATIEDADVPRE